MNILFTSSGRRNYIFDYFRETLKNDCTLHAGNSQICPAFESADKSVITPTIYDKNYIPFLKKYCIDNKIEMIISLFDIDLPILSQHKKEFEKIGVTIIVSDENVINICNDKYETYKFLRDNGFNTPKTYITLEDTLEAINNGEISYPIFIKPRWGMASLYVKCASDEESLRFFYDRFKSGIMKTYLKYESKQDLDNFILFQEKLDGQEHGMDIINDLDGNFVTAVVKEKFAMRAGETDASVVIKNDKIFEVGEKISKLLRHIANMDCDVFLVDGKPYVLEMNARFGGGYPFSHAAGINVPAAIIAWYRHEKPYEGWFKPCYGTASYKKIIITPYKKTDINLSVDYDSLLEFITKVDKDFPEPISSKTPLKEYAEKIIENGTVVASKNDGKITGLVAGYTNAVNDDKAFISFVALDPEYRGKGNASKLVMEFIDICRQKKFSAVHLFAHKQNPPAINLYKRLGFVEFNNEQNESRPESIHFIYYI